VIQMADTPLVSIVTPSYNQAAYLEDTLRSVLQQDYPAIEYLVADGASTDASPEIIARYAARYPEHLTWWVSEPDKGQADAINKGFCRARGEIMAWLNSDDVYLPGAVSRAVEAFQARPELGLVYGDALTVDPRGRPLNQLVFGEWGLTDWMRFRIICQPAVFMRREVLERAGWVDSSYHFLLDHQLWLRMARLAPVAHLSGAGSPWGVFRPLAAARHHPAAKNLTMAARVGDEINQVLAWMESQPDLAARIAQDRRHVYGGAYRLTARYLLEGNQPGLARCMYGRALRYWPSYALKHVHRMLYAGLCLAGLSGPIDRRRQQSAELGSRRLGGEIMSHLPRSEWQTWKDWPGICLEW